MNLKRLRWGAGALFAGIVTLMACDGSNLFDPSQNPFIEPRVAVTAPSDAFAGDTMVVAISATAAQNVSTITVSVRGATSKDTTLTMAPPARSVNTSIKVGLPAILTDTLIYVSAVATDAAGNVSKVKSDTVSVLGPPVVVSVTTPDSLKVGTTATVRIHAFGSRRITQMDLAMRGAVTKDTTIFVVPPANDVTQSISFTLPATVADTAVRLGIIVKDVSGLSSIPATATLPLAIAPPAATVSAVDATVSPGQSFQVTVRGTAMRGVAKVGVVLSGAMSKDTALTIDPPQSDVSRSFQITVPGDVNGTQIGVSAYAIDRAGVRSVPSTNAAVTINTGVPVITSVTTSADSVRAGQPVDVRVVAQGVRPITTLTVRFRGAAIADQTINIVPAATNVSKDFSLQLPVDVSDTILTITAVATDQANQLSAITAAATKIVRVTDTTAPTVSATPNVASTSAGSTIQIRINARDNVALKQVGYAVVNPAGDTIGTTPTLATTSGAVKDTTFSFLVPSTLTPRTVRVLGIAVDKSGRRGISTASSVTVADSAAPTITILAPGSNATLPLNDSVRVQLHIVDPTGIKSVTLQGKSTRVDSLGPTVQVQRFALKTVTFSSPLPRDTIITRYLNAIPDSISEPVSLIFTASDSLNNTATTTTSILVGGPRVELRNPLANAQVTPGGTLVLSAFAVDRSAGIDSLQISITGAQTQTYLFKSPCLPATCAPNGLPSNDSVVISQNYVVGPATGTINIGVTAWNRNRVAGATAPIPVLVSTTAIADTAKPQVRVAIVANDRVELTDTITLNIAAQDVGSNGVRRIGAIITAQPGGAGAPIFTLYRDTVYAGSGRTGLQPHQVKFTLKDMGYTEINLVRLPRALTFQVQAFAIDAGAPNANCGANVTNTLAALQCDSVNVVPAPTASGATWFYFAKNTPALTQLVTVVPGFARPLPTSGSVIADVLVDNNPARPRMYLSNQNLNRLEVLNLQDSTFATSVAVGSEPWGMFVNNAGNRLIVGNSGGTNISMVDITQPVNAIAEVPSERILTPNAVLFDVLTAISNGLIRYTVTVHDFSDRPQFVAQDQNGVILHSTKPTGAAPDGTVRYLVPTPPGSPRKFESKILFNRNAIGANSDMTAIADVDSIIVQRNSGASDLINIFDHPSGHPETAAVIQSGFLDLRAAIANIRAQGSDIQDFGGQWIVSVVGLSDTTFVTTSVDRHFVGFGEGATGPTARVWLWDASNFNGTTGSISDDISVQDLVGNASERVLGIALNQDGRIGGARGSGAAYFFSNDATFEGTLRLQGVFGSGVAGGNGGIALHPSHNTALQSNSTTLAFVATVNRSIKIVDTFNFIERGEIQIRDNIVGPLRAALPLAAENVGLADCDIIWVKLFGVTGAGKAVIINVRKKDIINPIITAAACPS